jgi:glucose uptake protein GlcU
MDTIGIILGILSIVFLIPIIIYEMKKHKDKDKMYKEWKDKKKKKNDLLIYKFFYVLMIVRLIQIMNSL